MIRNSAVHDLCAVDDHTKEYKGLKKYNFKVDAKFTRLSAPNEYNNISFDDFIIFARSCVEFATYLLQKNAWKKYTRERCEKAIFAYINTLFKVDDTLDEKKLIYLVDLVSM